MQSRMHVMLDAGLRRAGTKLSRALLSPICSAGVAAAGGRLPGLDLVQRRVAAGELRARLRQPILVLGTPALPLTQAADRIDQLEQLQAPQHLGRVEQVARQ